ARTVLLGVKIPSGTPASVTDNGTTLDAVVDRPALDAASSGWLDGNGFIWIKLPALDQTRDVQINLPR
ncbi:MAG: hypothetical protein AAFS10_08425, partial [Myxococcota bacterium]